MEIEQAIDFTGLPSELKVAAIGKRLVLPTYAYDYFKEAVKIIDVAKSDGRTPMYTWEFIDMIKKAEDAFNPDGIAKVSARIPVMQSYEIDTQIFRSELMSIWDKYYKEVHDLKTYDEAMSGSFALFFLQEAMRELIVQKIAGKAMWKGSRTATQSDRGAEKAVDGIIKKVTAGRGVGGDIPAGNVFDSEAITSTNVYDQVQGVCQLAYNSEELTGIPMSVYLSPQVKKLYDEKRHALSPTSVNRGEIAQGPDWMPGQTFVPALGLAGKNTIIVTPKSNLKMFVHSSPGEYAAKMKEDLKDWKLNILGSCAFDYGYGKYLFCNEEV